MSHKTGGIGMVLIDLFGLILLSFLFLSFNIVFSATVETKYEAIQGISFDIEKERTLLSILQVGYNGFSIADHIINFCDTNTDLSKVKELLQETTPSFSLEITCPDKKKIAVNNACSQDATALKQLVSSDPKRFINLVYCQEER